MKQLVAASVVLVTAFTIVPVVHHRPAPPATATSKTPSMLAGLTVDARSANPGSEGLARPECVAFELGQGLRYECGDLQARHVLPTTRVRNKNRTPMLLYNSATAKPRPVVAAFVSTPASTTADSITASLSVSGTSVVTTQFAGSAWGTGGVTRKIAVKFDGTSYGTGLYPYTMTITAKISGQYYTTSDTGSIVIINRSASKYGAGWWLASHERMYWPNSNTALWVGGDGSWLMFSGSSTYGFTASGATGPQSVGILYDALIGGWAWTRVLPDQTRILYGGISPGSFGDIAESREPNDLIRTRYSVNADNVVTSIQVPDPRPDSLNGTPAVSYAFTYTSGYLSKIAAPGLTWSGPTRNTTFSINGSGILTQITDPDSLSVSFSYAGSSALLSSRTDKRSNIVSITYDSAQRVTQALHPLNSTDTASTAFCAAEVQGLLSVNCSSGPMDSSKVATQVSGPRTDVTDSTHIWVTRAGMARKVIDALDDTTLITLGDNRFLGLPTQVRSPDGHTVAIWYNARGTPDSTSDLSHCVSGVCATTRFQWDTVWNKPTQITRPAGDYVQYSYDGYGNLSWQQNGSGSTSRTDYTYFAADSAHGLLLDSVTAPTGSGSTGRGAEKFVYDMYSNIIYDSTAEKRVTQYVYNLAGELTASSHPSPNGVAYTAVSETIQYDAMGRPIGQRTIYGTLLGYGDSVGVSTTRDAEGSPTAVLRTATRMTGSLTTHYVYDKANRKIAETAPDGAVDSTFYDKAGNATRTVTRRGNVLTGVYDAVNRLTSRVVPAITYDSVKQGIAALAVSGDTNNPAYPRYANAGGRTYVVPADTSRFTYDAAGHLLTANNGSARVTRTYTAYGVLASEEQKIRTWAGNGADSSFAHHDYTLQYVYDMDRRRVSIQHPSQLLPRDSLRTVYSTTSYAYDSVTGRLISVVDPFGQTHSYAYSPRGDLTVADHATAFAGTYPDITDTLTYTLDGLQSAHVTMYPTGPSTAAYLLNSVMTYNSAGGLTSERDVSGDGSRQSSPYYSELGPIDSVFTLSAIPGTGLSVATCQVYSQDAMGNLLATGIATTYGFGYDDPTCSTPSPTSTYYYSPSSGRLVGTRGVAGSGVQVYTYDGSGNLQFAHSDSLSSIPYYQPAQDRYSYYSADERLAASDARWADAYVYGGLSMFNSLSTVFEEYRYDALGRRVVVRSRKYCAAGLGTACRLSSIRRTVWDGDQELHEITMPGEDGDAASEIENDTLPITRGFTQQDSTAGAFDARSLFGRVMYVFGMAADKPEAVIRVNAVTSLVTYGGPAFTAPYTFRPTTLIPVYDESGGFVTALFAETGTSQYVASDTLGWRTLNAPSAGAQTAFGGLLDTLSNSFGTLLTGKQDDAGTQYRRNRSYDPLTGRFTQEDPVRLAGGLNPYSYAGGDPVNFSDPYGLMIATDQGVCTINAATCGDDTDFPAPVGGFDGSSGGSDESGPKAGVVVKCMLIVASTALGSSGNPASLDLSEKLNDCAQQLIPSAEAEADAEALTKLLGDGISTLELEFLMVNPCMPAPSGLSANQKQDWTFVRNFACPSPPPGRPMARWVKPAGATVKVPAPRE